MLKGALPVRAPAFCSKETPHTQEDNDESSALRSRKFFSAGRISDARTGHSIICPERLPDLVVWLSRSRRNCKWLSYRSSMRSSHDFSHTSGRCVDADHSKYLFREMHLATRNESRQQRTEVPFSMLRSLCRGHSFSFRLIQKSHSSVTQATEIISESILNASGLN